jgi:hypothetical protein
VIMLPPDELRQLAAAIANSLALFKRHKPDELSVAETRARLALAAAARHLQEEKASRPLANRGK